MHRSNTRISGRSGETLSDDGTGIENACINDNDQLIIDLTDGRTIVAGYVGNDDRNVQLLQVTTNSTFTDAVNAGNFVNLKNYMK